MTQEKYFIIERDIYNIFKLSTSDFKQYVLFTGVSINTTANDSKSNNNDNDNNKTAIFIQSSICINIRLYTCSHLLFVELISIYHTLEGLYVLLILYIGRQRIPHKRAFFVIVVILVKLVFNLKPYPDFSEHDQVYNNYYF